MLKIAGGRVYDPINGIDGEVRDIWVDHGRIVAEPPAGTEPVGTIDAGGMVVMPGGIDIHAHIAGAKVNLGRKLTPHHHRRARHHHHNHACGIRGTNSSLVPSTFATGYLYAGMGYTMAIDAAIAPLEARHAHEEFSDTPCIDKTMFLTMGNNQFLLERIQDGNLEAARHYVGWLLQAAKGGAIKVVNPGGVETWKSGGGNVKDLQTVVEPYGVTPAQIITTLTRIGNDLGLPHPVHIHCNNLGVPGNWTTTLETMKLLDGLKGHITHVQFNSYGGDSFTSMISAVRELAAYVNTHTNISVDVGQVIFGEALTMTADGPWQYLLHKLTGQKWTNVDVEAETGCGVVPYEYKDKSYVNALQWAIGLEWFLLVEDPWRVFMSTDHPNGGAFISYPYIIALLMDREKRRAALQRCHPGVAVRSGLGELDREYSLYEIAIITRAGPARTLGLKDKGHLGAGADADITIYDRKADIEEMFSTPRYVLKDGSLIIEEGELRRVVAGRTYFAAPGYDSSVEGLVRKHFEQAYSVRFDNYPVDLHYLPRHEVIPCRSEA